MPSVVECRLCAFQDVQGELCDIEFSDAAAVHFELPVPLGAVDDLIGVSNDSEVRVVRDDDRLSPSRGLMYSGDKLEAGDRLVVEVLFWLVEK